MREDERLKKEIGSAVYTPPPSPTDSSALTKKEDAVMVLLFFRRIPWKRFTEQRTTRRQSSNVMKVLYGGTKKNRTEQNRTKLN
ncbi:hypothetical protein M0804_007355 [Polistes exclamans]|nr:hypothetical protein M0804_007355 [Polistes exclamans]